MTFFFFLYNILLKKKKKTCYLYKVLYYKVAQLLKRSSRYDVSQSRYELYHFVSGAIKRERN